MSLFLRNALALLAFVFPVAALAQATGTPTLSAGSTLSLDTGTVGTSGGDILWDGTNLTPQGSATAADLTAQEFGSGMSTYAGLNEIGLTEIIADATLTVSPFSPAVNDVLALITNGGNEAKILVTAISGTSISLKFKTFAGSSTTPTGNVPIITGLQNNYSGVQPGLPSYGIAPASLFIIYGTGMSNSGTPVLQSSAAPGLPLTLNGTSISVTVNGITTTPAIYYTSPTQIAAVLPSSTPVGSGTITVTYNNTPSAPATILVTKSAFGIDTLYGTGSGGIVATVGSTVILPTGSATPGQTITIWGSGLGADTANNDRTFPLKQDDLKDATVYIGNVKATVTYAGRSQYPGVDQIDVVVPSSLTGGCGNSVAIVANGLVSNFGTLPVNPGGGVCTDPDGETGNTVAEDPNRKSGLIQLDQATVPTSSLQLKPQAQAFSMRSEAMANFGSTTGGTAGPVSYITYGNCIVDLPGPFLGTPGTTTGLDAGASIGLSGGGISVQLAGSASAPGSYSIQLSNPLTGGDVYTFTGPGGAQVGSFKVAVTFPVLLNWTNEASISTVTESQGQLVTWTGGAPGTYVAIGGQSSTSPPAGVVPESVSFECFVPVADQQFTVPSYVLLALPTGNGTLGLSNNASPVPFTATGIDGGVVLAGDTTYNNIIYR
jgi:uncharacterized protein (TIGR03437 family)